MPSGSISARLDVSTNVSNASAGSPSKRRSPKAFHRDKRLYKPPCAQCIILSGSGERLSQFAFHTQPRLAITSRAGDSRPGTRAFGGYATRIAVFHLLAKRNVVARGFFNHFCRLRGLPGKLNSRLARPAQPSAPGARGTPWADRSATRGPARDPEAPTCPSRPSSAD